MDLSGTCQGRSFSLDGMRRFLLVTVLGMLVSCQATSAGGADGSPAPLECRKATLPLVQGRLARHEPVRIVAIGSSSIEGIGATTPEANFVGQLRSKLSVAYPGQDITVFNKGIGGEVTRQTLARFEEDVVRLQPHLVILQAGLNDVLNGIPLATFSEQLDGAFTTLRLGGYDTLFMDMQAYQEPESAAYRAYLGAMHDISLKRGVPVLPRHDLMNSYVQAGLYTRAQLLAADGLHMNDVAYEFTAQCALHIIR